MNLNESILKIDGLDSLSLIKSGVYKDTYGCMYKGKNAILGHYRIHENHFNLSPEREANILIKINDLQLAPATLFFDEKASIIITSMIEGEHLSQLNERKCLISRIAKSLLSLHSNDFIGVTHTFRDSLIAYREHLTGKEEENIFTQTIELYDSLSNVYQGYCLCHNDLHPENVLFSNRIQFIDWEYASLNLPYFDLAYAIEHFQMNKCEIGYFISEYSESIQDIGLDTINKYRKLSKYTTLIWLLILDKYYTMSSSETELMASLKIKLNV